MDQDHQSVTVKSGAWVPRKVLLGGSNMVNKSFTESQTNGDFSGPKPPLSFFLKLGVWGWLWVIPGAFRGVWSS